MSKGETDVSGLWAKEFGIEAVRALILINGGALVAFGTLVEKIPTHIQLLRHCYLVASPFAFAFGLVAAVVAIVLQFANQLRYQHGFHTKVPLSINLKKGTDLHWWFFGLMVFSTFMILLGSIFAIILVT